MLRHRLKTGDLASFDTGRLCICCGVRSKRDHSILNNSTTCDAAFRNLKFVDHLFVILYLPSLHNVVFCALVRLRFISSWVARRLAGANGC